MPSEQRSIPSLREPINTVTSPKIHHPHPSVLVGRGGVGQRRGPNGAERPRLEQTQCGGVPRDVGCRALVRSGVRGYLLVRLFSSVRHLAGSTDRFLLVRRAWRCVSTKYYCTPSLPFTVLYISQILPRGPTTTPLPLPPHTHTYLQLCLDVRGYCSRRFSRPDLGHVCKATTIFFLGVSFQITRGRPFRHV